MNSINYRRLQRMSVEEFEKEVPFEVTVRGKVKGVMLTVKGYSRLSDSQTVKENEFTGLEDIKVEGEKDAAG